MFGKKKRMIEQQRQRIAELEEQVKGLTAQNDSFNARIAEVEQRESGIGRAISEATLTADRMIGDAQRKAGAMLEQAQQDTDAAKRDAERLVDDAYRNARDIVKEAETEGERKLGEVQERIDTYASLLQDYDRMVQEQIAIAQENARRFAELSRALHEAVPQILSAEGKLLEPAASEPFEAEQLPESEPVEPASELPENDAEPVENVGDGTPLDETEAFDPESFHFTPQQSVSDERLWTVDEIAPEGGETHVDAIIDEILTASEAHE